MNCVLCRRCQLVRRKYMKWLQSLGELLGTTHLSYKARFTPVTKSNSTRSTLSKVSTVSHWRQTVSHWRQSQKDVRRSGDKNYPLSTQSTELNMFSFGDNVDRDKVEQADDSRLSTNRRHIRKYQRHSRESTLPPVLATVDCRQCVCTRLKTDSSWLKFMSFLLLLSHRELQNRA